MSVEVAHLPIQPPEKLSPLGISFREIGTDTIKRVNTRDFNDDYRLNDDFPLGRQQLGLFIDDTIVGYTVYGLTKSRGASLGRIAMIHVSPALRDLKLGSLLAALSQRHLALAGAEILEAEAMGRNPKSEHLLHEQGFRKYKIRDGNSHFHKRITSDSARETFVAQLNTHIEATLQELQRQTDLRQKAAKLTALV